MSRPLRIEFPNACYFILNRARRGERVFEDSKDCRMFIDLLEDITQMFDIQISAFCLIPTGYYLLVQTPQGNLARAMRHLNGIYTQRYNRHHRCDGPLFRGRYKSTLIDQSQYYLDLIRYIHRIPLTEKLAKEVHDHTWSSHFGYLSKAKKWDWLFKKNALQSICPGSKGTKTQYIKFVNQPVNREVADILGRRKWPIALGSDPYIRWLKSNFASSHKHSEIPDSKQLLPDIDSICACVEDHFQVKRSSFFLSQRGQTNLPRDLAIYLCRNYSGFSHNEIGRAFKIDNHSTISSVITKIRKQIKISLDVRKHVEELFNVIKV
ncbi:MAG: transposase [Proteobacteria bacterium]|nr:transposase [Pseudomonadota bacterium]